jgi:hypothetical protein
VRILGIEICAWCQMLTLEQWKSLFLPRNTSFTVTEKHQIARNQQYSIDLGGG